MDNAPAPTTPRGSDRRRVPTSPWAAFRPNGRRAEHRRIEDRRKPYFVDRFNRRILGWIFALLIFTTVDGVFTLLLLERNFHEANPAMRLLLRHSAASFLLGKYALTAGCIPVFLIFRNFHFLHRRIRVSSLIPTLVVMYVALVSYQVAMLLMVYPTPWSSGSEAPAGASAVAAPR
jgi:hypothetical protein